MKTRRIPSRLACTSVCFALIGLSLFITACKQTGGSKHYRLAFVTNNASDFWTIARKGTEKAAAELPGADIEFRIDSDGTAAEQTRIVDDLLATGGFERNTPGIEHPDSRRAHRQRGSSSREIERRRRVG